MKKLMLIVTLLVTLALCLVACNDPANNHNEGQSQNTLWSDTPKTEEPTSEEPTGEEPTSEKPTNEESTIAKSFWELNTNDEKSSKLRWELIDFLRLKHGFIEPVMGDLASQIERNLYWGDRFTHVQFDDSNYYFVCGYYNCEHNDENKWYSCIDKYTWVIVENEKDIPEYYNDLRFIVAFQINKALSATDISNGYHVPIEIEHYLEYTPKFINGKNVADKLDGNISYIYFVSPTDRYIIDSINFYFHDTYTLYCIEIDEKWYIRPTTNDLEYEFGQYYDDLIDIAEERDNYVIIEFNAFAEAILQ